MEVVEVKSSKAVKTHEKTKGKSTSSDVFSEIIQSILFQNVKQQDIQNKDLKKSGYEVNIKSIGKNISASNNKALPKESTNEKDIEKLIQDIKSGIYTRDEVYSKILKLSEYTGKSSSEILTMLNGLNENTKDGLNNNEVKPDALQMIQHDNKLEAKGNDVKKLPSLNEIVDKMMNHDDSMTDGNGNLISEVSKGKNDILNMNSKLDNIQTEISKSITSDKTVLKVDADAKTQIKNTVTSTGSSTNKIAVTEDGSGLPSTNSKFDNIKAELSKDIASDKIDSIENNDTQAQTKDKVMMTGSNADKTTAAKYENRQPSMNSKLDNIKAEINKNIASDVTDLKENTDAKTQIKSTVTSTGSSINKIAVAEDENGLSSTNSKLDNIKAEINKNIASDKIDLKENNDTQTQTKDKVMITGSNADKTTAAKYENKQPSMNSKFDNIKAEISKNVASDVTDLKENTDDKVQIKGKVTIIGSDANKTTAAKDDNIQPSMNLKLDNIKAEVSKNIASDVTDLKENADAQAQTKGKVTTISNNANKIAVTKDENGLTSMNSKVDNIKAELNKNIISDINDLKENADNKIQIKNIVTTTGNNVNKISVVKDENRQTGTNVKLDNIKPEISKDITADKISLNEDADTKTQMNNADLSVSSKNLNKADDAVIFADNAQSETNISSYSLLDKNNKIFKDSANIQGINVISNGGNKKPQLDSKSDGSGKQSNLQMNYTAKLQNKIITPDLKDSSSNFEKVLNMQSSDISQSSKTAENNKAESGYISSSKDLIDFTVRNFKTLRLPGFTELKLKLKPAELGEITIKVVLEKGQIDGVITAERKEVADMLNNGMDSLKQNLKNNNITFNNLNVNIDNSGNYGNDSSSRGGMYDGKERGHHQGSFENELEKKEKENEKGFSILA